MPELRDEDGAPFFGGAGVLSSFPASNLRERRSRKGSISARYAGRARDRSIHEWRVFRPGAVERPSLSLNSGPATIRGIDCYTLSGVSKRGPVSFPPASFQDGPPQ
jgi:hypothetical protein